MLNPHRCAADAGLWPQVAEHVLRLARTTGSAAYDLRAVHVVVPSGTQVRLLYAALRRHFEAGFIPPRVAAWPEWGQDDAVDDLARRVSLFDALRGNAWVRTHLSAQSPALWRLAQQIEAVADELTYAAVNGADAMTADVEAVLARRYRRGAARAVQPQARLLLDLWRAGGDALASQRIQALNRIASNAAAPLVFVAAQPIEPWLRHVLARYAERAAVVLIEADVAAVLADAPVLAAAWPELTATADPLPIAARADALRGAVDGAVDGAAGKLPVIVRTSSLEEEAGAAAQQVVVWLGEGFTSIALIALDRLTARRVRALLERAQVLVRDETGWKLSTTGAAAAVMRWLDVVSDELYWRDVLDWLKSAFTFADRPNKAREVAALERAIRTGGAVQGVHAMLGALDAALARAGGAAESADSVESAEPERTDLADLAGARELLTVLDRQARGAARGSVALGAHVKVLQGWLDALGMRAALAADPVGEAVLREIDAMDAQLAVTRVRVTLADFRALLAARFEELSFVDRGIDAEVVLVSLAATPLRRFDAAILIGADALHLPSVPADTLFLSHAVRSELGLANDEVQRRRQSEQLALLLATVPRVVATWRESIGDEPNALSPLLERLQFVAQRAAGLELVMTRPRQTFAVHIEPATQPAPVAASLLPDRISASQAQSLVNCAYQFYARCLLRLAELEDVVELPDKRDFGEALHEVLRRFHRRWCEAAFHEADRGQLAASLREHAHAVFGPQIERAPALLAFARRFDGLVNGYLDWLCEHSAAGWRWAGAEERHGVRLPLRNGREVELTGRIDRIDADAEGRLRVLDYKARSAADLKKAQRDAGEDIQLPFYGLLLAQPPESAAYVAFQRASDRDRGVHAVEAERYAEVTEAVAARLRRDLERIADGAALPAHGAASVCDRCEMRGLCRRDYWEQSGERGEEPAGGQSTNSGGAER